MEYTLDKARTTTVIKSIGLIAGDGKLPVLLARSAKEKGFRVIAVALSKEALACVADHADKVHLIAPGQVGRGLKLVKDEGISQVVFIGRVPKINLLRELTKLDWTAIKELSKLPNFNDDTIQRCVGDLMERHGVRVLTQREFLKDLFPQVGVLTKQVPTVDEYADIDFGFKTAKEIAKLDIGQTVVVKNQMIIAVEAIEGTDRAIARAVELAQGQVVVVKVAKVKHDPRFDTPTVGMSTLHSMLPKTRQGGVLAIAAGETLMVEPEKMIEFADAHKIAIVAMNAQGNQQ